MTATPELPAAFADISRIGAKARELLVQLPPDHQKALADYLLTKLRDKGWAHTQLNQEVVKVVLDELSASAPGSAKQLGLVFCARLAQIEAPWMRILVNLTVAELLSRLHVHEPACSIAYVQTFRSLDTYLTEELPKQQVQPSLFDPMSLARGDLAEAREIVLTTVLPFGESALRLLWGAQAHALRDGDEAKAKALRAEEVELASALERWMESLGGIRPNTGYGWRRDLNVAIAHSKRGEGPSILGLKDTPPAQAVQLFLVEIEELLCKGKDSEADRLLKPLHTALSQAPYREFTTMRAHLLHISYLRAILEYRRVLATPGEADTYEAMAKVRSLWREAESLFDDPSVLWPRDVIDARNRAIRQIPRYFRETPRRYHP